MKKAIVSFALGDKHSNLLQIALPSFYKYATKHNYDLFMPSHEKVKAICNLFDWDHERPPSWLKIPILKYLLEIEKYDLVLWLDSDIIINKTSKDIFDGFFESSYIQGLVFHQIPGINFNVPNCGAWVLKQECISLLNDIWNNKNSIDPLWWEQGSLIDVMFRNPITKEKKDLFEKTCQLPFIYNVHLHDKRYNENSENDGIILHATMHEDMVSKMKMWANSIDKE
jgi:hypothetical protein